MPAALKTEILKQDPISLVERQHTAEGDVVRKTYRPRPGLLWRTFLQRGKARREFENLQALRQAGIRCVEPLAWEEERRFGCVPSSALVTRLVPATATLKETLATAERLRRARLLTSYGDLLRQMHKAGLLSGTFYPRNILVGAADKLTICDQPYAVRRQRDLLAGHLARIDLFDAAFSEQRRRQLSPTERLRFLVGYCAGDRRLARRLWSTLHRRIRFTHRFHKGATLLARLFRVGRIVPGTGLQ